MRVLFLDFDGVLNSEKWFWSRPVVDIHSPRNPLATLFDPAAVARLNRIIEATGAKVVISSAWRRMERLGNLRRQLRTVGFKGRIVGTTPEDRVIFDFDTARGFEIQAWLKLHPAVTSFVILDDDADMVHLSDHLVLTSWRHGLLDVDVPEAIKILNQPFDRKLLDKAPQPTVFFLPRTAQSFSD